MHIFTGLMTVRVCPKSSSAGALRSKGDVVIDVLAPLHQQLRVGVVSPFAGASDYFPADPSRLLTKFILGDFYSCKKDIF